MNSEIVIVSPSGDAPAGDAPAPGRINPFGLFKERTAVFFLQLSHRVGAVALLALLAAWAMMFVNHDFRIPLAVAAACADTGLCSALIARMLKPASTTARREANGVAIFNLVVFVLAIYLMVFTRLENIHAAASQFFTPTPVPSAQE